MCGGGRNQSLSAAMANATAKEHDSNEERGRQKRGWLDKRTAPARLQQRQRDVAVGDSVLPCDHRRAPQAGSWNEALSSTPSTDFALGTDRGVGPTTDASTRDTWQRVNEKREKLSCAVCVGGGAPFALVRALFVCHSEVPTQASARGTRPASQALVRHRLE